MEIRHEHNTIQEKIFRFWSILFFSEEKEISAELDEQQWARTRIYMFTTATLVALWGVFDVYIDFENVWIFLALRAIYTPITLLWAYYFYLPIFRQHHKAWALVHYLLLIIDIGVMVLWTDSFVKYLVGFSTIFWGASVIMLWRFWYTVIPGIVLILIAAMRFNLFPHGVAAGEFVTGLYFFTTCLVFASIISAYGYWSAYQLAEKNITLKKTLKKLMQAEKMSSMNMLVASVAHEINTPVGTALTGVSHAKEEFTQILNVLEVGEVSIDQLENPASDGLVSLQSATDELLRTTKLVEKFKQTAVDQSIYEKRTFDLAQYIEENIIQVALQPRLKGQNINVVVSTEEAIVINSFPGEFSQVFTNLITNSIAHGYSGIDLSDQPGRILIHLTKKQNGTVNICYKDDGRGMPSEVLAKVFDPFFTTKGNNDSMPGEGRHHRGTGLGMSIVYNIITQKLCGTIEAISQTGSGAEFIIDIPPH